MMRFMVFALQLAVFFTGACPDLALASGGISEFTGPLEKVVNTLTGPAGKFLSIAAFGITFIIYLFIRCDAINTSAGTNSVAHGRANIAKVDAGKARTGRDNALCAGESDASAGGDGSRVDGAAGGH